MSELGSTASFGSVAAPRLIAPLAGYRYDVLFPSCFARSNAIRILHLSLKHGLGSRPKVAARTPSSPRKRTSVHRKPGAIGLARSPADRTARKTVAGPSRDYVPE